MKYFSESNPHQKEYLTSKILTTPSAEEDLGQLELSVLSGGTAKGYSHFGRQVRSFLQGKYSLTT